MGLILSTFIPEDKLQLEQAIDNQQVAYELVRRGGWITSAPYNTLRKNAIYAFSAGSVLSGNHVGKIVDLAPKGLINHPVWRCGKTIVLPIKL
jgi:CRISPR type III-A-associated RAMP protein Csm4